MRTKYAQVKDVMVNTFMLQCQYQLACSPGLPLLIRACSMLYRTRLEHHCFSDHKPLFLQDLQILITALRLSGNQNPANAVR